MQEFRLLSTSGILGYGFPEASLAAGLVREKLEQAGISVRSMAETIR